MKRDPGSSKGCHFTSNAAGNADGAEDCSSAIVITLLDIPSQGAPAGHPQSY